MDIIDAEKLSLTSEASLTRIHAESDLPFDHTSRHTKSGFLVEGHRLNGYIPTPPGKWQKKSIFDEGIKVGIGK